MYLNLSIMLCSFLTVDIDLFFREFWECEWSLKTLITNVYWIFHWWIESWYGKFMNFSLKICCHKLSAYSRDHSKAYFISAPICNQTNLNKAKVAYFAQATFQFLPIQLFRVATWLVITAKKRTILSNVQVVRRGLRSGLQPANDMPSIVLIIIKYWWSVQLTWQKWITRRLRIRWFQFCEDRICPSAIYILSL